MRTKKAQHYTPCGSCPFRTDVEPYLRRARAREIVKAIRPGTMGGGAPFHCHKTVDYSDDEGEGRSTSSSSMCAGSLILLAHDGSLWNNQMVRIAERLGMFDPSKLDMDAPVFTSIKAWIAAQER